MNLANPSSNATTRERPRRILIVGASARAAAAAANRAGLLPLAIDRFNDVDLSEICEQCAAYRLAFDIPRLADEFPSGDWIYTGPLENHPRVLRSLAAGRRLLGNDFETVSQIRDPWNLYDCLRDAGVPVPKVCRSVLELGDGLWLKKPLRSAGGCGIEACERPPAELQGQFETRRARSSYYYQEYVAGTSCSAVFLAANKQTALLGVTEQLIGPTWNASGAYQYAGSIGPVTLPSGTATQLHRLAASLSDRFELRGLFGVDFILAENNVWPVEVNPRYTASAEVIELATNLPLLKYHVEACLNQLLPSIPIFEPSLFAGKLILYAKKAIKVSETFVEQIARQVAERGDGTIADIPRAATELQPGDPICTVLLTATTANTVKRRLATIIAS